MIPTLRSWFRNVLRQSAVETSLDDEMLACVEILTADKITAGIAPAEARRQALLEIGGVESVKARVRQVRRASAFSSLVYDCRAAIRSLRRHAGLSTTNVALIALSVAFASTIFAVLDAVVLRRLPVPNPEQLVLISEVRPDVPSGRQALTAPLLDELRRYGSPDITHLFGFSGLTLAVGSGDAVRPGRVFGVSGDYFAALGARPAIGRLFGPDEREPVAVISSVLWQAAFGSDPGVLGRAFQLGAVSVPIVGVTTPQFVGTQPDSAWEAIMPLDAFQRARGLSGTAAAVDRQEAGARLRSGVSADQLAARLNDVWSAVVEAAAPPTIAVAEWKRQRGARLQVGSLSTGLSYLKSLQPGLAQGITATFSLAAILAAATCLTIALLAVARAVRQQRQTAVMIALGAPRARIVRPYLVETAIVTALGCALGLGIGAWTVRLAAWFAPGDWRIAIDGASASVGLLAAGIAGGVGGVVGGILLARVPALSVFRQDARATNPHLRLRMWLLTAQLAVSLVLLHYSVVYVTHLSGLMRVPVGFAVDNLQAVMISGTLPRRNLSREYFQQLIDGVRQIPRVEAAALTGSNAPLSTLADFSRPVSAGEREIGATTRCVFPGYFATLGVPLLSGRDVHWDDTTAAVVTSTLAANLFPEGSALGGTIHTSDQRAWQIVGIVGDVAYSSPRLPAEAIVFPPCLEWRKPYPNIVVTIMIRSARPLDEIVRDVRPVVVRLGAHYVFMSARQSEYLADSLRDERLLATVSGVSGSLIMLLTALGLYGFCAYVFTLRRRELAIRAALGAAPRQLGASLLVETARILVFGVIIGTIATFAIRSALATVVVDLISPTAWTLGVALGLLLIMVATAVGLPALRAARQEPANALRLE
jgi:predicted permease